MTVVKSKRAALVVLAVLYVPVLVFQVQKLWLEPSGIAVSGDGGWPVLAGEIAGHLNVSQTLHMRAAGFEAITVKVRPWKERPVGTVFFRLFDMGVGNERTLLFEAMRSAEAVVAADTFTWRFHPIANSRDRRYELEVSMPSAPPGQGLGLVASADRLYRDGLLRINGKGQWGDLVFTTGATSEHVYRGFASSLRGAPEWMRSPVLHGAAFACLNACLCLLLWLALRPGAVDLERSRAAAAARRESRVPVVALALLVVGGLVLGPSLGPRPMTLEEGAIDLIARFPGAVKAGDRVTLEETFDIQDVTIDGLTLRSLFAAPGSRVAWTVDVPPRAVLRASAALKPNVWNLESDGAVFSAGIDDGERYTRVAWLSIQPQALASDRRWFPVEVDLSAYAGRRVTLYFFTEPGLVNNPINDECVWGAPRIVAR